MRGQKRDQQAPQRGYSRAAGAAREIPLDQPHHLNIDWHECSPADRKRQEVRPEVRRLLGKDVEIEFQSVLHRDGTSGDRRRFNGVIGHLQRELSTSA